MLTGLGLPFCFILLLVRKLILSTEMVILEAQQGICSLWIFKILEARANVKMREYKLNEAQLHFVEPSERTQQFRETTLTKIQRAGPSEVFSVLFCFTVIPAR